MNLNQLDDSAIYHLDGVRVTFVEYDTIDSETIDSFAIQPDKEEDTSIVVTTTHPKEKGKITFIVNDNEVSKGIKEKR